MAAFRAAVPPELAQVIRHLPPNTKRAVRSGLDAICANHALGEELRGELSGLLKVRVGKYRIVYRVDAPTRTIEVRAIGHRRSIYEELAELLRRHK